MAAYLAVMHSNDGCRENYLPMIKAVCEAGSCPWVRYAQMYDRSLLNDNLPQRYGTHTRYNEQTRTEELYPLEDEAKVDEWRRRDRIAPAPGGPRAAQDLLRARER